MLTAVIATGAFLACNKKKEYAVTTPPSFSSFANQTGGSYYIQNTSSSAFYVPVGISTVTNYDRKVVISVTNKTGATSAQFSIASTTVTVPAGRALDSLVVKGVFSGYTSGRIDTLVFTITGGDVPVSDYNSTYTLVLQQYCPVVLNNLLGTYNNCYDVDNTGTYGPYTAIVTAATSTGATSGTLTISGFSGEEVDPSTTNPVKANLDWSNPANFTTAIPAQTFYSGNFLGYGPLTFSGVGTGSFSSCNNTLNFSYTLTVSAGSFGNFNTYMAR